MLARVNVRWLLAVLIVLGLAAIVPPILDPPPGDAPPTLVDAAASEGEHGLLTIADPEGRVPDMTTVVPVEWFDRDPRPFAVSTYPPAPGVTIASPADREQTALLLTHGEYPRIGPFVHRVLGGLPAVELAYGTAERWTGVATYVFAPAQIVDVRCPAPARELSWCATALNDLAVPS